MIQESYMSYMTTLTGHTSHTLSFPHVLLVTLVYVEGQSTRVYIQGDGAIFETGYYWWMLGVQSNEQGSRGWGCPMARHPGLVVGLRVSLFCKV